MLLTLLLHDLLKAVQRSLVLPLRLGLLGLHLQPAAHGVERVRGVTRGDRRGLGDGELGAHARDPLVVLPGVLGRSGVVEAEVHTAVPEMAW